MPDKIINVIQYSDSPDLRWKDLYRIGCISCIVFPASIIIAIVAYLILGFQPGAAPAADIFATFQSNMLKGLLSIELLGVISQPFFVLQALALYVALKQVNESYALIALVFELIGIVLYFTARPVAEMAIVSAKYALASGEMAKAQYLAAGEALNALFNGTSWILSQILTSVSGIISSLLMLRTKFFGKGTAYLGIVSGIFSIGIVIPGLGAIAGLIGTTSGIVWFILLAKAFYKLGWSSKSRHDFPSEVVDR